MNQISKLNTLTPIQNNIKKEIAEIFVQFGATSDLISIIMSWGDTIDENETLESLKNYRQSKMLPLRQ